MFNQKVNSNIKIYLISNAAYYGAHNVINAFLAILITSKIAPDRADIVGYLITLYLLVRALVELLLSRKIHLLSEKTKIELVSVSYIMYGIITATLGFSTALWQIFFFEVFIALIDGIVYPLKWTLFSKSLDKGNEETEWSLEDVVSTLVMAFSSSIAGTVSYYFGMHWLFIFFGMLFVVSGIAFAFMKPVEELRWYERVLQFRFQTHT